MYNFHNQQKVNKWQSSMATKQLAAQTAAFQEWASPWGRMRGHICPSPKFWWGHTPEISILKENVLDTYTFSDFPIFYKVTEIWGEIPKDCTVSITYFKLLVILVTKQLLQVSALLGPVFWQYLLNRQIDQNETWALVVPDFDLIFVIYSYNKNQNFNYLPLAPNTK